MGLSLSAIHLESTTVTMVMFTLPALFFKTLSLEVEPIKKQESYKNTVD